MVLDGGKDTQRPESQFEMLPDTLVDRRNSADNFTFARKLKNEMPQRTEEDYENDTP
jgi:hypothetical protein